MTISLKEYCGYSVEDNINAHVNFKESIGQDFMAPKPDTLMVEVEGIHAYPFHTRNYTRYMPDALKKSQSKWTTPYLRPLIKHHNDQNGEIIGRIYNAEYVEKTGVKDIGGLLFTVSVPDEKVAKDVENRILETVSIGVEANDVKCSICGSPITNAAEGCPEGHHRGMIYEGETCYWDVYDIEPKELSYVIVPSDIFAKNKKIYRAKDNKAQLKEFENKTNALNLKEGSSSLKITDGGNNSNMELEKQLADAKAEIERLKAEAEATIVDKAELKKEVEDLKAKNAELEKTINDTKELLNSANTAKEVVEKELATSKEDLTFATQEKEQAEKAGMEAQEAYKSSIVEMTKLYRSLLNKPELDESKLQERSIESLKDSINDFKEEYDVMLKKNQVIEMKENKISNPVAPQNAAAPKTKSNPDYKTIDLEERFSKLFKGIC